MSLQTATDTVAHGARRLADDVLQSAQDAVQTTRSVADHSLDQAEERLSTLRNRTHPAIDDLTARAQALAARSIDYCADTGARARRQRSGRLQQRVRVVAPQRLGQGALAGGEFAALAGQALGQQCGG